MASFEDPVTDTRWTLSGSGAKKAVMAVVGMAITFTLAGVALNFLAPMLRSFIPMDAGDGPSIQLGA